jgi:hypothetical protein
VLGAEVLGAGELAAGVPDDEFDDEPDVEAAGAAADFESRESVR